MNKKDKERIEQIFSNRFRSLRECAGELALEKIHEGDDEYYDNEIEKIDDLMNLLFFLKREILDEQ
jgi:hypothetical protein